MKRKRDQKFKWNRFWANSIVNKPKSRKMKENRFCPH